MAASQLSNSAALNETPTTNLRIDVGVVTMRRPPDHLGWRLVTTSVRWYRALCPEARSLLRALAVAFLLSAVFIRLVFIVEQ
jgi:hypothetical protein